MVRRHLVTYEPGPLPISSSSPPPSLAIDSTRPLVDLHGNHVLEAHHRAIPPVIAPAIAPALTSKLEKQGAFRYGSYGSTVNSRVSAAKECATISL